jgi:hypothetical protein
VPLELPMALVHGLFLKGTQINDRSASSRRAS